MGHNRWLLAVRVVAAARDSQFGALEGLQAQLADVVADMKEQGEGVPVPLSEFTYSSEFNLRLGEKLHREAALHAAEENLSINQWVVRKLHAEG